MTAYLVDTNLLLRSLDPSTPQGSQALAAIKRLLAPKPSVHKLKAMSGELRCRTYEEERKR